MAQWRKGAGAAAAGVAGNGGSAYAGLDLNLITFACASFSGARFKATTVLDAR